MNNKKLIAIAGGIGSGKSVVSSILRVIGYSVYDCDSEAKRLMNESCEIKDDLISNFGEESILSNGSINTAHISKVVFNNPQALKILNSIVHPRVKDDVLKKVNECAGNVMFIESAILLQSNLLDIIDGVWLVDAPENVRIERVIKRNSMSEADVKRRISAQSGQDYSVLQSCKTIVNDDKEAILPQVLKLVSEISL